MHPYQLFLAILFKLKSKINQCKTHCAHDVSRLEELLGSEEPIQDYVVLTLFLPIQSCEAV